MPRSPTFFSRLNATHRLKSSASTHPSPLKINFRTTHCPIPQTKLFFSAGTFKHYFQGWMFQDPETKVTYSTKELLRYLREDVVYEAENFVDEESDKVRWKVYRNAGCCVCVSELLPFAPGMIKSQRRERAVMEIIIHSALVISFRIGPRLTIYRHNIHRPAFVVYGLLGLPACPELGYPLPVLCPRAWKVWLFHLFLHVSPISFFYLQPWYYLMYGDEEHFDLFWIQSHHDLIKSVYWHVLRHKPSQFSTLLLLISTPHKRSWQRIRIRHQLQRERIFGYEGADVSTASRVKQAQKIITQLSKEEWKWIKTPWTHLQFYVDAMLKCARETGGGSSGVILLVLFAPVQIFTSRLTWRGLGLCICHAYVRYTSLGLPYGTLV